MIQLIGTAFVSAVAAVVVAAGSSVSAAPLLAVDFNNDNGGTISPTQSDLGFTGFTVGQHQSAAVSAAVGGYTVSVSRQAGSRDRGAPAESAARNLYTDGVFANDGSAGGRVFDIKVEGLESSTQYDVTFYSFSPNFANSEETVYTPTIGAGAAGQLTFNRLSPPTNANQYSLTLRVTTDADGVFQYTVSTPEGVSGEPFVSGFTVSAIPEPTSMSLVTSSLALILARRRQ